MPNPGPQDGQSDSTTQDGPPLRVLVVEDESLVREGIGRLLAAESSIHLLPLCSVGAEALSVIRGDTVDVVLLDFNPVRGDKALMFIRRAMELGFRGKFLIITAGLNDADV